MEKEMGQIKFTETDDCIRIEITGDKLKENFPCCFPIFGGKAVKVECCPDSGKKEGKDKECC